jgi:hypothetical protein
MEERYQRSAPRRDTSRAPGSLVELLAQRDDRHETAAVREHRDADLR